MLPNFLIIGAQKSGTSSLWQYLRRHPQIFMTLRPEPAYFSGHNLSRGLEWYQKQFRGSATYPARGECTPGYTMYPTFPDVPRRIASLIPDVKLIYVVRHPVDRMRSHYHHRFVAGMERAPIDRALRDEPQYVNTSRYSFQIEQYMCYFRPDHLLVVVSEALRTDRRRALRQIFRFLGVDDEWWSPELEHESNVSDARRLRRPFVDKVMSYDVALRIAEHIPSGVKESIRTVSHRPPPTPELSMSEELERELEDRLREDVRRLRRYLPAEFDGWGIA